MELQSLAIILVGITTIVVAVITYYKRAFRYWKKRNVPGVSQPTIPFGTSPNPFTLKLNAGVFLKNEYDCAKSKGHKHVGLYALAIPFYLVIDLEFITNILQRDFGHFNERAVYYNEKDDPISSNLFTVGGEKWRTLRTRLSPLFTSRKIKMMFNTVLQCCDQLQAAVEDIYHSRQCTGFKEIAACYTIDVIGSCAFGLECNSFKHPNAEFRQQGRKVFELTLLRLLKVVFALCYQNMARWLGITLFDKESNEFFRNIVVKTKEFRKTHNIVRQDMLQLLFDLKSETKAATGQKNEAESGTQGLSTDEMAAQVFIFFAGGFDTSSTTLTYCLYELAINSDVQSKLREEISFILSRYDSSVTFDAIADMKYMDQVVNETLRKYPPLSFTTRRCVKDYKLPGTDFILEKGTDVIIPILGIHRDPDYYPDPERFDPERFSEENKRHIAPFTYMPFGEGARICIGRRFGLMQIKVALAVLLKNYSFSLNSKTSVPLEPKVFSFTLEPCTEVFLDIKKL